VSQYATKSDLEQLALPPRALEGVADADINAALIAASSEADSYIATRYPLPLATWPKVLSLHVAAMAAWHLKRGEGFQPEADGSIENPIRTGYEDALAWLTKLAKGLVSLSPAETSPAAGDRPAAASDEPRGF
jgi:phage gp36-like protein